MDHLKTAAAVIGTALGILGLGTAFGRSEVAAVEKRVAANERADEAVHRAQDERIQQIAVAVGEVKDAAEKTADEARKVRQAVEEQGVRPARGGR